MILDRCAIITISKDMGNLDRQKRRQRRFCYFYAMRYEKQADPFYRSGPWRELRVVALQRDHYICQDCLAAKARGEMIRPRRATMVHHIKPLEEYPELALDLENLVSLCDRCHNKRHPEKGRQGTKPGIDIPLGIRIIKV